jgi:Bacterial pre-peptidase C-terminal domain
MTLYDLGTINSNSSIKRDNLTVTNSAPDDVFKFRTTNSRSVNLLLTDIRGGDPDLELYRDSNGNGTLQIGTDQRIDRSAFASTHDDQINRWRGAGTYFARVYQFSGSPITYDLYVSATQQSSGAITGPPNLLARENDLGNLTSNQSFAGQSVGFRSDFGNFSFSEVGDTSDIYAFTLGAGRSVNITLDGLSADADLRLIRDSNNGRTAGAGETLDDSTNGGTTPDSIFWTNSTSAPITYYAQVYPYAQTPVDINYNLNFEYI